MIFAVPFRELRFWDGTDQKRSVTITGDEMKYTNTAVSSGGKRAKRSPHNKKAHSD